MEQICFDYSKRLLKEKLLLNNADYFYEYFDRLRNELSPEQKPFNIIVVIEDEYVDKCYLRDYAKYYAEGFTRKERFTKRIHFFLSEHTAKVFQKNLLEYLSNGSNFVDEIRDKNLYLGYIIRKPIKKDNGYYIVGRSNLRPYPSNLPNNVIRNYLYCIDECSLFGIRLKTISLPFKQQDIAVGACASAALWSAQYAINDWFPISIKSLAEITEESKFYFAAPVYPSEGLRKDEICKYFASLKLPFHTIEVKKYYDTYIKEVGEKNANIIMNSLIDGAISAYFEVNFPIVCMLRFIKFRKKKGLIAQIRNEKEILREGYHAVVISGYKEENYDISALYLHDDGIGPYCKTKFGNNKMFLENNWRKEWDMVLIETFLIPIDPIIKLSFTYIFENYFNDIVDYADKHNYDGFYYYLSNINSYKEEILSVNKKNKFIIYNYDEDEESKPEEVTKQDLMLNNFPKYLWIIRYLDDTGNKKRDIILDATRTLWHQIAEISY